MFKCKLGLECNSCPRNDFKTQCSYLEEVLPHNNVDIGGLSVKVGTTIRQAKDLIKEQEKYSRKS